MSAIEQNRADGYDEFFPPPAAKRLKKKSVSFNDRNELNFREKRVKYSSDCHRTFDCTNVFELDNIEQNKSRFFCSNPTTSSTLFTPSLAYMGYSPVTLPPLVSNESIMTTNLFFSDSERIKYSIEGRLSSISARSGGHDNPCSASAYDDEIDEEVVEVEVETPRNFRGNDSGEEDVSELPQWTFQNCCSSSSDEGYIFSNWEVGSRYTLRRKLGRGSYGEVAEGFDAKLNRSVAIKRILNVFDQELDAKRLYREMFILRSLNHTQVIRLIDVVVPKDYDSFTDLYLVFEYVDTDLYKLIMSPQYLTDEHIQTFLYQMLAGLKHIHSAHVIHRDLKPANILLNEDCTLKICDFGLSRVVGPEYISRGCHCPRQEVSDDSDSSQNGKSPKECASFKHNAECDLAHGCPHDSTLPAALGRDTSFLNEETGILKRQLTKHVVTRWYRSPELILLQDYTSAVDVWSLGCIFAELLSMEIGSIPDHQNRMPLFPGKSCFPLSIDNPTTDTDKLDQLNVIFNVIGTPCEDDLKDLGIARRYVKKLQFHKPRSLGKMYPAANPDAIDLLEKMLSFNPSKRITVNQALEHQYLASTRRSEKEKITLTAIPLDVENVALSKEELKRAVYQEVLFYQNQSSH